MITGILALILILMFIYGIYSVVSGKFALRKKSVVKGRPARIAGLIFLSAPVLWILITVAADAAGSKNDFAFLIAVLLAAVISGFSGALWYLRNHSQ
jgi:drug/metabolite transporter (DMT)-like permease